MDDLSEARQRWLAECDAAFERLERLKRNRPNFPEEKVEADIAAALAPIRAGRMDDAGEGEQAG
ncbi:MAG TPA: hypothetical protein VHG08_28345 [Longimicrobium sp.]|nr:hypothetical protein [Longimicrobium sp.]